MSITRCITYFFSQHHKCIYEWFNCVHSQFVPSILWIIVVFFFIYLSLFLQFLCSCFVVVVFVLWFSGEWTTQRTPQSVTIDCKILLRSNVNFLRSIWRLFGWQGQRERVFVTLCICVRLCMSVLHVCWCVTRCAFAECLNSASTYVGMTVWLYLLCMWMY